MATDITIRIAADGSAAVAGIKEVSDSLGGIDTAANSAASGGIGNLASGMMDMAQTFAVTAPLAADMVGSFLKLGESVQLTTQGLNAMSGGQADQYLTKMSAATHGLVSDMDLAHAATLALSTGVVSSADGMAQLAKDGAALGRVFQGDATTGIETLTRDLEMVGNTRGLKQLGIDAQAVTQEFTKLKASGMDVQEAWNTAVMDQANADVAKLGDTFDTAGSEVDKFGAQLTNVKDTLASIAATTFEKGIDGFKNLQDGVQGLMAAFASGQAQVALGWAKSGSEFGIGASAGGPLGEADMRSAGEAKMSTWYMNQNQKSTLDVLGGGGAANPMQQGLINAAIQKAIAEEGVQAGTTSGDARNAAASDSGTPYSFMTQSQIAQMSATSARRSGLSGTDAFQGATQLNQNLDTQLGKLHDIKDAEAGAAQAAEQRAQAEAKTTAALQAQTAAQILGAKSNTLGADIASGADSSVQAGIGATAKKGSAQETQELADAKRAKDSYMIATGQATVASIQEANMQDDLNKKMATGKISADQYYSALTQLYKGMDSGLKTTQDLDKEQFNLNLSMGNVQNVQKVADTTGFGGALKTTGIRTTAYATGDGSPQDPYAAATTSAKNLQTVTADLTTKQTALGAAGITAGGQVASGMSAASGVLAGAASQASSLLNNLMQIAGRTWNANVNMSVSGAGAVNGSGTRPGGRGA